MPDLNSAGVGFELDLTATDNSMVSEYSLADLGMRAMMSA